MSPCRGSRSPPVRRCRSSFYQSVAVDPKVIPLGSRVYIPAYRNDGHGGWFIAQDTGGADHRPPRRRLSPPPAVQGAGGAVSDRPAIFVIKPHGLDSRAMPKQQRTMRIEQRSQLAAMQQLEGRSDEELEAETRYKAAAQAILGARAAERYDAKAARAHFQRAMAAARPQERMQLRRMADASLALAERRAGRPEAGHRAARGRGADAPDSSAG